MATTATKVGPKFQVTIPQKVRKAVGLKVGDVVEAKVGPKGTIVLHPKVQLFVEKVDWESLPVKIKRGLKEAEADRKAGRVSRPYANPEELIEALRGVRSAKR